MNPQAKFHESEIRAAEHRLETALEATIPPLGSMSTRSTRCLTGGGDQAVEGRESLLVMAGSMRPLRSVSIRPLRTEGRDDPAVVWAEACLDQRGRRERADERRGAGHGR